MGYNQNSGYGQALFQAVHAAIPTFGRILVVLHASDTEDERYQKLQEVFRPYAGRLRFFTSVSDAYTEAYTNNHDVIILDGDRTHTLTGMLTVAKNRVHFIGLDWLMGTKRPYGQSAKLSLGVTTVAADVATIKNTGVRNSFRGIKFLNSNTKAEALYTFLEAGEYTFMEDCEITKSSHLDVTGASELVANGDSSVYKNCWIGSTTLLIATADLIRACVLVTEGIGGTLKKAVDNIFEDCVFARRGGHVNNRLVYGANAADTERMMLFKNCLFYGAVAATAVPAGAIGFGATQTAGSVIVQNSECVGITNFSTTTGVFLANPLCHAQGGEAIQAA